MRLTWVAVVLATAMTALTTATADAAPPDPLSTITVVETPGGTDPSWNEGAAARRSAPPSSTTVKTPGATFVFTYREPIDPALKPVFEEAGRRWGAVLSSSVPIQVVVRQLDSPDINGIASVVVRGSADPRLRQDTSYPPALISAVTGQDVTPPGDPQGDLVGPECVATGCDVRITIFGSDLYTGLDGRPPADKADALSLVTHEIGHGLGFLTDTTLVDGGADYPLAPTIYDRFLADASGRRHTELPSPSAELRAAVEDNPSFLVGPATVLAHGRPLRVFSTKPFFPGASLIHPSAVDLPGSVMNSGGDVGGFLGVVRRIDTPTLGILADLGWPMRTKASVTNTLAAEFRGSQLIFPVALAQPAAVPVTIGFTTKDGSAKAGSDYTARTGKITIGKGQRFGVIAVPVLADSVREPTESMTLELAAAGAGLARSTATGTIVGR